MGQSRRDGWGCGSPAGGLMFACGAGLVDLQWYMEGGPLLVLRSPFRFVLLGFCLEAEA